ncbi:MAG TPA: DUF3750 domain-containing protein [Candidatus Competibacteraceae bacterium]|nr:DUF3750 domain-containing protein [Candidatus Competibacteraceae bacterium]
MAILTLRPRRWSRRLCLILLLFYGLPLLGSTGYWLLADHPQDWRTARRDSTSQAPDPRYTREAVLQVYAGRAFRWRGIFAVHTWIAAKPTGADHYTRFEVIGFGVAEGAPAVRVRPGVPDGYWFGSRPTLLRELRGPQVDGLIARLHAAAARYPYNHEYRLWPGPNSNTFTAYLAREVPELGLDLPANAIGKNYIAGGGLLTTAPSGSGMQFSLYGLLSLTLGWGEGVELDLLGLAAGLDFNRPALRLSGVGRIGFTD